MTTPPPVTIESVQQALRDLERAANPVRPELRGPRTPPMSQRKKRRRAVRAARKANRR